MVEHINVKPVREIKLASIQDKEHQNITDKGTGTLIGGFVADYNLNKPLGMPDSSYIAMAVARGIIDSRPESVSLYR